MFMWIIVISKLGCCLCITSNEMYNVFDEDNVEFGLPMMNLADDSSNNTIAAVTVRRFNTMDYMYTKNGNGSGYNNTETLTNIDIGEIPTEILNGTKEIIKADELFDSSELNIQLSHTVRRDIPSGKVNDTNQAIKADGSRSSSEVNILFNNTVIGKIPSGKLNDTDDVIKTEAPSSELNTQLNNSVIREILPGKLKDTNEKNNTDKQNTTVRSLNDTVTNKFNEPILILNNVNELYENDPTNKGNATVNAEITDITNASEVSGDYRENLETLYFLDAGFKDPKPLFTPVNFIKMGKGTTEDKSSVNYKSGTLPSFKIPPPPFTCPEKDPPANIGPYEVPTQRDTVLHVRVHLLAMYNGFHTKAMHFLKDIKEATRATWARKMLCRRPTDLMLYRRCVRWVANISVLTTKSLVTALEVARQEVASLIDGKICNISALNVDPIHLIRILAAEKVSLEFALPDFLRQLHACARHCPR